MLKSEMQALTELEQQEAIASKWFGCVLVVCLMLLAMYLIWSWYRSKRAELQAEVAKTRWRTKQTEIAWKYLNDDDIAKYKSEIAKLRAQVQSLEYENANLRTRNKQLARAK